ncbi:unnamed protein product [Mortierella alpina]
MQSQATPIHSLSLTFLRPTGSALSMSNPYKSSAAREQELLEEKTEKRKKKDFLLDGGIGCCIHPARRNATMTSTALNLVLVAGILSFFFDSLRSPLVLHSALTFTLLYKSSWGRNKQTKKKK